MKKFALYEIPFFQVGDGDTTRYAQFMVGPEMGNHDSLSIDAVTLKPHSSTDSHIHDTNKEMMFFLDGGNIVIDGQDYALAPRTQIIVEEGEAHMVVNKTDEEITLLCTFSPPLPKNEGAVSFIESTLK